MIDALLAVEAETVGPEVRLVGLPRGIDFPPKKANGGAWRGPDGLRVMEGLMPEGLVKRGWLRKHSRELPGSLVYFASVDVSTTADAWAIAEDVIVADLRTVIASLAVRDVKARRGIFISVSRDIKTSTRFVRVFDSRRRVRGRNLLGEFGQGRAFRRKWL